MNLGVQFKKIGNIFICTYLSKFTVQLKSLSTACEKTMFNISKASFINEL